MVFGLLVTGIVLGTYAKFGAVEALRAATTLVMPLSLIWLLFLATSVWLFFRRQTTLGAIYLLIWIAMTLAFNQHVANWTVGRLEERPYASIDQVAHFPLRTVVVLGGGVHMTPAENPEMNRDGQRVFTAAQLWHAGKTQTIICTGERSSIGDDQSEIARKLLVSVGVPDQVIFEIGGENTSQEMRNLKQLLQAPPSGMESDGDVALITSAFHMPRAIRLAEENGLDLIPIPCCYRNSQPIEFALDQLIPGLESGVTLRIAIKELLAGLVGR